MLRKLHGSAVFTDLLEFRISSNAILKQPEDLAFVEALETLPHARAYTRFGSSDVRHVIQVLTVLAALPAVAVHSSA